MIDNELWFLERLPERAGGFVYGNDAEEILAGGGSAGYNGAFFAHGQGLIIKGGDGTACLGYEEHAGRIVPGGEHQLKEEIVPSGGDVGKVKASRAAAA